MALAVLFLILGFLLLMKGADFFVDGASSIAKQLRIPSLVIGLTIVAFGTSAPELAVSVSAALKGSNDIAIGNVVGSNIFNLLIVVGISAVIFPLHVKKSMIKKDYPISIIAAVLLGVLAMDTLFGKTSMELSRVDGIILLVGFAVFMYLAIREGLKGRAEHKESGEEIEVKYTLGKSVLVCIIGLAGIIIGGNMVVDGAKEIARAFGLSEAFIGLTIVAFGTSLPELVTSVTAARRGNAGIAIGNIVGSNIFNILFVIGTTALICTVPFESKFIIDTVIAVLCGAILWIGTFRHKELRKPCGVVMLLCYVAYFMYLCLV